MRRSAICIISAALLAACQPESLTPLEKPQAQGLHLADDGLRPAHSDLRIDFGRAEAGVIAAVKKLLTNQPTSRTDIPDCGTVVQWGDQIELTFIAGNFRGWAAKPGQFHTLTAQPAIRPNGWETAGKTCL